MLIDEFSGIIEREQTIQKEKNSWDQFSQYSFFVTHNSPSKSTKTNHPRF